MNKIPRKEQRAVCINQSNDAQCSSPRPNRHKSRKAIRRTASKRLRAYLRKDLVKLIVDSVHVTLWA